MQYAATKDFKKPVAVLVKKNKTTIKKGIKSKKTYYMRVRAYKTVNGKKIFPVQLIKYPVPTVPFASYFQPNSQ